jgi:hypothetical protein
MISLAAFGVFGLVAAALLPRHVTPSPVAVELSKNR